MAEEETQLGEGDYTALLFNLEPRLCLSGTAVLRCTFLVEHNSVRFTVWGTLSPHEYDLSKLLADKSNYLVRRVKIRMEYREIDGRRYLQARIKDWGEGAQPPRPVPYAEPKLSTRAQKVYARIKRGHWYTYERARDMPSIQELHDAGFIQLRRRVTVVTLAYVPVKGYTPFEPERYFEED